MAENSIKHESEGDEALGRQETFCLSRLCRVSLERRQSCLHNTLTCQFLAVSPDLLHRNRWVRISVQSVILASSSTFVAHSMAVSQPLDSFSGNTGFRTLQDPVFTHGSGRAGMCITLSSRTRGQKISLCIFKNPVRSTYCVSLRQEQAVCDAKDWQAFDRCYN